MLVILFYLITISRATIVYISNNFIGRMSRRLESTETAEMNLVEEIEDKEGLEREAKKDASKMGTTSRRRKNKISVIDSRGLNSMVVDGPMSRRSATRSLRKRTLEQASPSTSSSPMQRTRGRLRKMDSADVSVTNNAEYTEDEEAGSKPSILEIPTSKESDVYNMNLKRRGLCVIFNQQQFCEGNGDFRHGSEVDVKSIERTFGNLGFEVQEHLNLTFCEVMDVISNLSKNDYTDCDCICIFLLTHGGHGSRVFAKDASYPFLNIWSPFTADNCRTLAGKPKLFFVQACKGVKVDEGVRVRCVTDGDDNIYTLPTNADFLFGYSTMEAYYSWRSKDKGTWYIQSLCEVIDQYWKSTDLLKMLTITSRKVAFDYVSKHKNKEMDNVKQMPSLMSTLTRDIYFTAKNDS